ncbi:inactive tyrosine-protein kinase PEAK1-like [Myxocyprinus asiaticus]|uniref:inactive tyrosine-protein kinase PEAK1-like n=1 Tax=Myxocyprinus asiaticus TaxID=70543 RepID=UPI002221FE44|nr:inactive tyrosine-protein kinase PEAK1-like [Myxocyprinus asiaticus]
MHQVTEYALLGASGVMPPPSLPIKQRRSKSSSSSSIQDLELKVGDLHSSGPQTPLSPFTEVFNTPTDCNAAHCPIHHRYEQHQARFFSDQTPPPIPKKTLTRTLSLPTDVLDPPYQDNTSNYENPLYMITPLQGTLILKEEDKEEQHQAQSMHQVTFDTPDEQLYGFFRSFRSHEQVSVGIEKCYLQFLRKTLQNTEMNVYLNEQEMEKAKTSQPNDFLLCGQQWTKRDIFLVHCPKIHGRLFSARVHKGNSESDCSTPMLHPNIEQDVVHFPQSTFMDQTYASQSETAQTTPESSQGSGTEVCQQQTVVSLLMKGVSVTIVRDFPLATLEDFVEDGHTLHWTHPEVYERRLCLIVLQLVLGLQHLGCYNVIHRELKPQSVMLVWPSIKLVECRENPTEIKKGRDMNEKISIPKEKLDKENLKGEMCQTLWEKWGTPRVVLNSHVDDEVFQATTSLEFQLGNLLKNCLHLTDSGSSVWKAPQDSPYIQGLLWLVTHLTSEKPGLLMADVSGVLQVLLWGPRKRLFQKKQLESTALSNWLLLKRSLLVLKLAEKGLFHNHHSLDWEDYLCLQYLSFTNSETLCTVIAQMGLHDFVRLA